MAAPRSGFRILPILLFVGGLTGGILLTFFLLRDPGKPDGKTNGNPPSATAGDTPVPPVVSPPGNGEPKPREPNAVLAETLATVDRDARAEGLRHLARRMVAEDLTAALAMMMKIPKKDDRDEFTRALFAAWAEREPQAALDYAKGKFAPGDQQAEAMGAALEKWAASNPRAAGAWIEAQLHGPLKEQAMTFMVQGWARQDPAGAAAWFVSTGSTSQSVLTALVTGWADLNPRAAAVWVESLQNAENKLLARVSLANQWAMQDPAQAAAYFTPMIEGGSQGQDIGAALINSWGTSDPAAAAKWVETLPAGSSRNAVAGTLATIWATTDIQAAVKWSETLADPAIKAGVIGHLGTAWGATEPIKALAWLETLPDDESRREAVQGALNSWAGTDQPGLAKWLATQPAGPRTDVARQNLGEAQVDSDPPAAMKTVEQISDPNLRQDVLVKLYRQWAATDSPAAHVWLQTAPLPDKVRAKIGLK